MGRRLIPHQNEVKVAVRVDARNHTQLDLVSPRVLAVVTALACWWMVAAGLTR